MWDFEVLQLKKNLKPQTPLIPGEMTTSTEPSRLAGVPPAGTTQMCPPSQAGVPPPGPVTLRNSRSSVGMRRHVCLARPHYNFMQSCRQMGPEIVPAVETDGVKEGAGIVCKAGCLQRGFSKPHTSLSVTHRKREPAPLLISRRFP